MMNALPAMPMIYIRTHTGAFFVCTYFITVCTKNRHKILSKIVGEGSARPQNQNHHGTPVMSIRIFVGTDVLGCPFADRRNIACDCLFTNTLPTTQYDG